MKKQSGQALLLVLLIVMIFTVVVVLIAGMTTRELEFREVEEAALKAYYAAESGNERARYYLKQNSSLEERQEIRKDCQEDCSSCNQCCPDSTNCNSSDCDCDKNPLNNNYSYTVTITPTGQQRPNKEICDQSYCIDASGLPPQS